MRSMKKPALGILTACLILTSRFLLADVTSTVFGVVTDPSGAVIPKAGVLLSNPQTGFRRTTTTDATGSYTFLDVPVGEHYVLQVSAPGFEKALETGIRLLVNQSYRADFRLRVGTIAQAVEVSAAPVQVETSSTQLGDVIESRKMTSLPLNGRSYIDLLALQPGVVPITSGASNNDTVASGDLFMGLLSVNGARESANQFLVNGADVEESRNNVAAVIPTLDSIQEFRILTDTYDAEYGRFAGGIVNVVTKSGTNGLHGTVFEFLRNDKLDARNFFDLNLTNPATGQEIPGSARGAFKQNQFGYALGGPLLKNRLFFFTDYQGTRQILGSSTGTLPVPSLAERSGDFSDVGITGYPALTGSVRGGNAPGDFAATLSERLGYAVSPGEIYRFPGCSSTAQCVFPNQVIPQRAWSPVALKMLGFIPVPTGSRGGAPFFSTSAFNTTLRDDKFGQRLDVDTARSGLWSFYYHFDDAGVVNPYAGGNVPGFAGTTPTRAQNVSVSNTHNCGSSAVNVARLSYTRFAYGGTVPTTGLGPVSNFGFTQGGLGLIPSYGPFQGAPQISLKLLGIHFGASDGTTTQHNNTFEVQDSYARIVGQHSIKVGGELRYFQVNEPWKYVENGSFGFQGGETGNDFADFLLGAPDSFVQASPGTLDARSKYAGFFGQDSFKVAPNFTLNYGLRWEVTQPWYDTQNRLQAFVPRMQSTRFPGSPEGWVFAGDPGIPKTIARTRYGNLAPRLGIAYSPGVLPRLFGGRGHTSFRAGFGVYYTAYEQIADQYELGNAPFGIFYVSPVPVYLEEPYKNRLSENNPGQRFPYSPPTSGTSVDWAQFQPITIEQGFKTDNVTPYEEQFNFNIQRQIGKSFLLTLGYVGSVGRHLLSQASANPGIAATCEQIASLLIAQGRSGEACGPFGEDSIYQISPSLTYYGTRPYSVTSGRFLNQGLLDFGEEDWIVSWGVSSYNALQASFQGSAGPITFLAAYTWSKSLDDMSGFTNGGLYMNPFHHNLSKGFSAFNMTHHFVVSYNYNLPLQRLSPSVSGLVHAFLSGWSISGITQLTTGLPIAISESGDHSLCNCEVGDEPNYNGRPVQFFNPRRSANHQYFSTGSFSAEPIGHWGTSQRFFFSGPGLNNWDVALRKTSNIMEHMSVELRAEFFNAFNHAQFTNAVGDFAAPNFGDITGARDPRIGQLGLKVYF
jgi:hypothetical protein